VPRDLLSSTLKALGLIASVGVAGLIALSIPPVLAGEDLTEIYGPTLNQLLPNTFDPDSLLIIDDDEAYRMQVEPSISTDVLSNTTIRKIEGGRTRFVTIATTSTGTYSSDGLTSPHIRYPGVHVEQLGSVAWIWSDDGGWTALPLLNDSSVTVFTQTSNGFTIINR
jgi:hypothetical protein